MLGAGVSILRGFRLPAKQRHVRDDPQMQAHRFCRALRAARLDGGKNAPGGFKRAWRRPWFAERFDPALLDNLGHRVDQMQKYLVASGQRDSVMKSCIA